MQVFRSGIFLATSTAIKLLLGLLAMKVIAHYLGTTGFGMLGQFMSLISILTIIGGGGLTNGIISRVSSANNNIQKINLTLSSGLIIGIFFSFIFGIMMLITSSFISYLLFESDKFSFIIKITAILQFLLISSTLFGGYLNGLQRSKEFSIITIISSFIGIIGLVLFVYYLRLIGAMLGLVWMTIVPGILFLLYYFISLNKEIILNIFFKINIVEIKNLLKYSLMLISSAVLIPIAQIFIRDTILNHSSWENVGFWQASVKISDSGLQFITVILTNYYLPEIGKIKSKLALSKLLKKTYFLLSIILFSYILFIHFLKQYIVPLLFSSKFLPTSELLTWQAIGDSFRILSYVVGFVIVSKAKLRIYLLADVLIVTILSVFSFLLIPKFGVIGANYAYFLTYFLTFTIGLYFMIDYLKK